MSDEHLNEPPDDALPSRGVGLGVGGVLLLLGVGAVALAAQNRAAEARDSERARAQNAAELTEAPMARYPGGIDARPIDSSRPVAVSGAPSGPAPLPAAGPPRKGGKPPPEKGKMPPPHRPGTRP